MYCATQLACQNARLRSGIKYCLLSERLCEYQTLNNLELKNKAKSLLIKKLITLFILLVIYIFLINIDCTYISSIISILIIILISIYIIIKKH